MELRRTTVPESFTGTLPSSAKYRLLITTELHSPHVCALRNIHLRPRESSAAVDRQLVRPLLRLLYAAFLRRQRARTTNVLVSLPSATDVWRISGTPSLFRSRVSAPSADPRRFGHAFEFFPFICLFYFGRKSSATTGPLFAKFLAKLAKNLAGQLDHKIGFHQL